MGGKKKTDNKPKAGNQSAGDGDQTKGGGKLKGGQKIQVRHILCSKHSKKETALAEIKQAAADRYAKNPGKTSSEPLWTEFVEAAKKYSEDKASQGGNLDWKTKGSLHAEFENVAYSLRPTQLDPKTQEKIVFIGEAKTAEGYHLIVVDARG
ncbi:hypothetical protein F5Y19DRAFT_450898 [Xylariaceae sp. FL1651]|nr:hypothetical protein F5Y19DRAFT_450898 [Xylariaceae sp. FL1651]